jgi:hypothetical protein
MDNMAHCRLLSMRWLLSILNWIHEIWLAEKGGETHAMLNGVVSISSFLSLRKHCFISHSLWVGALSLIANCILNISAQRFEAITWRFTGFITLRLMIISRSCWITFLLFLLNLKILSIAWGGRRLNKWTTLSGLLSSYLIWTKTIRRVTTVVPGWESVSYCLVTLRKTTASRALCLHITIAKYLC